MISHASSWICKDSMHDCSKMTWDLLPYRDGWSSVVLKGFKQKMCFFFPSRRILQVKHLDDFSVLQKPYCLTIWDIFQGRNTKFVFSNILAMYWNLIWLTRLFAEYSYYYIDAVLSVYQCLGKRGMYFVLYMCKCLLFPFLHKLGIHQLGTHICTSI